MLINQIDDAVRLRNYRKNAIKLREASESGHVDLVLWHAGEKIDPASHICIECVRRAIAAECDREIADYERQLTELGITVSSQS